MSESEDLPDVLRAVELLRCLVAHKVDCVVIGGLAVAAHGYERATKDLDIVPAPDRANLTRLLGAFGELAGRPLELGDLRQEELPVAFDVEGLAQGGNWFILTKCGRVDVLQYIDGAIETLDDYVQLRKAALELDLPGIGVVAFAGYEDLVKLKRTAGRERDLRDLEELEQFRRGGS